MLDYIIEQHRMWLLILGILAVVSLVEAMLPRNRMQVSVGDRLLNLGAGSLFLVVGGYLGLLIVLGLERLNIFQETGFSTVLYVALFLLLQDCIYYFYHRLQHSSPLLWGLHKLHHTDRDVNITTSYRTHVLEQPVQTIMIFVPLVLFLGYHPTGTFYAYYLNLFFLYLGHSRLDLSLGPLSKVLVGPRFHRVHHSVSSEHMNKNFAQYFSFLDLAFGTFARPRPLGEIETGVAECTSRRDQWIPIVWPLSMGRNPVRRIVRS